MSIFALNFKYDILEHDQSGISKNICQEHLIVSK